MELLFKLIELGIAIGVLYIGLKQRSEDKKDKTQTDLDEAHRSEIKSSIDSLQKTLQNTKEDIFFMFDNHNHEIECDNKNCGKIKTVKTMITLPQQQR